MSWHVVCLPSYLAGLDENTIVNPEGMNYLIESK